MYCQKCGHYNDDQARFCNNCGSALTPAGESGSAPENHGPETFGPGPDYHDNYDAQYVSADPYPAYSGGFGIKERSIPLYLILSIVTCGLFSLYWYVMLVDDLNIACDERDDTSGIMVLILSIVTCGIYGLYWFYKAGNKVGRVQQRYHGYYDSNLGILYLIISLVGLGIVNYALIQNELNKIADYR